MLGVFRYERLSDVVLAGHSYGGMVITGVADRIADKIKALAYLDAFVPEDGQSLFDINIPANTQRFLDQRRRERGLERAGAARRLLRRERRRCRDGRCARDAVSARLLHREAQADRRAIAR